MRSTPATPRTRPSRAPSPAPTGSRRPAGGADPTASGSRRRAASISIHPGALRVPDRSKGERMDLLTRMVEHHIWLVSEMLTRAERLPDEVLDAPVEISVDGHRLRSHAPLPARPARRPAGDVGRGDPQRALRHRRRARSEHRRAPPGAREAGPAFLAQVRAIIDEGRLDETFVDAVCDPPEVFTYGGMIAHVLTFAAHRRTLVCGALADAGVTDLGSGDPMRWVASASSRRAASARARPGSRTRCARSSCDPSSPS